MFTLVAKKTISIVLLIYVIAVIFEYPQDSPPQDCPSKGAILRWGILISRDIKIANPIYLLFFMLIIDLGSVLRSQDLFSKALVS